MIIIKKIKREEFKLSGEIVAKYVIDYKIETLEPLAIGGTDESVKVSETDRKVLKNAKNIPFIPGSSIKGVIRSNFNRLSSVLNKTYKLDVNHRSDKQLDKQLDKLKELVCDTPKENEKSKQSIDFEDVGNYFCDLCLFFGAKGYGAPLQFTDCCLELEDNIVTEKRTHIRISTELDTTIKGGLFSAESVPKGVIFKGKIIYELKNFESANKGKKTGRNLESNQKILLGLLLNQINNKEIYLGGMKSRGYGLCKFNIEKISEFTVDKIINNENPNTISLENFNKILDENKANKSN